VRTHPPERDLRDDTLTALYHAHALAMIRLGYVILGDRQAAEDVVQESFVGLHRHWGNLTDEGKALRYLRASVLNGSRTALRRRRPATTLDLVDDDPVSSAAASPAEDALLAGEDRRLVMRAIQGLPERQREVLVLRFYLDAPDAEIARLMGIRESTVRSTAHRALRALATILGDDHELA
jgi:RNA polymerase sigma factor (sigma-70 family)